MRVIGGNKNERYYEVIMNTMNDIRGICMQNFRIFFHRNALSSLKFVLVGKWINSNHGHGGLIDLISHGTHSLRFVSNEF